MSWLDDQYHDESSPDLLLTDGRVDIAIEIKQLTDGESFHTYDWTQQSLYRRLAPDTIGSYVLSPPVSIDLPLEPQLVEEVKARVAIAATELQIGGTVAVPILRRASVRFLNQSDDGVVICLHARSNDARAVSREVAGVYLFEDDGPDHQFLSPERRLAFHRALSQACEKSKHTERAEFEWFEEWELRRGEDSVEGEGGVLVIAAVAGFLEAAAIESVEKEIRSAKKKFEAKKWAGLSAVALHAGEQQHQLSLSHFTSAIARLEAADVQPLDGVLLVKGEQVHFFNFSR